MKGDFESIAFDFRIISQVFPFFQKMQMYPKDQKDQEDQKDQRDQKDQ